MYKPTLMSQIHSMIRQKSTIYLHTGEKAAHKEPPDIINNYKQPHQVILSLDNKRYV